MLNDHQTGPKQHETYLSRLKEMLFAKDIGIQAIELHLYEEPFPCRLEVTPKNPKDIQKMIGKISAMDIPVRLDVRPNRFFIDLDEPKFLQLRSTVTRSRTEETTHTTTTTIKRRISEISSSVHELVLL